MLAHSSATQVIDFCTLLTSVTAKRKSSRSSDLRIIYRIQGVPKMIGALIIHFLHLATLILNF